MENKTANIVQKMMDRYVQSGLTYLRKCYINYIREISDLLWAFDKIGYRNKEVR